MTVTRLNCYPPRPAAAAELGFNCTSTFTPTALAKIKEAGGTLARAQLSWSAVENPSTKALSLTTVQKEALVYCAANGIKPVLIAAYGPAFAPALPLTVGATAAVGAYTIPISAGSLASIALGTDFVIKGASQIVKEGKWAYYGALIESVNVGAGTITVASALTTELKSGDTLTVNRLTNPPIFTSSPTAASVTAYLRYVKFLAEEISTAGATGYVCLWNELPWAHDPWANGKSFYDVVPGGVTETGRMRSILEAALEMALPSRVALISGATDKSGHASGIIAQGLKPTVEQIAKTIQYEGVHNYTDGQLRNPEGAGWDPGSMSGSFEYQALNAEDQGDGFVGLAWTNLSRGSSAPSLMATECGLDTSSDSRQAIYDLRRVLANWGMGMATILYSLAEGTPFNVLAEGTLEPREAFTVLKRLTGIIGELGAAGGSPRSVPSLIGCIDHTWPLLTCGFYGANGGVVFAWQRTHGNESTNWEAVPTPATYSATFRLPSGYTVKKAINVRTGATITPTVSGTQVTLSGIGEDVVALITEP